MLNFVETMKPKDHIIMFYTDRQDKYFILFSFLKAGLMAGEAAIYVAGEDSASTIRKTLKDFGLDNYRYEGIEALTIVDYRDWYLLPEEFDIQQTISLWKEALEKATSRGYKGLRVVGEMACFFKHNKVSELLEYERALHQVLEIPITAICAYDDKVVLRSAEDKHYLRLYMDLIAAHSTILFSGPKEAGIVKVI